MQPRVISRGSSCHRGEAQWWGVNPLSSYSFISFILFYYSDMYYTVTKSITKHKQKEIPSPLLGL